MFDERKTLEKIKKNIALSNFVEEMNSKENDKGYSKKKFRKRYELRKRLLAIICSIAILAGGAYAYERHLKLNQTFFKEDEVEERPMVETPEDSEIQFTSFNGYLVSNVFSKGDEHSSKPHGHDGIDIVADKGTTILSVYSGTVKEVGFASKLGRLPSTSVLLYKDGCLSCS